GGEKAWSWVKKGVPIRLEIGKKECSANTVFMGRRDREYKNRMTISRSEFLHNVKTELDDLQTHLLLRAKEFRNTNSVTLQNKQDFYDFFKGDGGFALAHWSSDPAVEAQIKQDLGVTTRCLPLDEPSGPGVCIFTGKPSQQAVIFAKAY